MAKKYYKRTIGDKGERKSRRYLKKKGYKILEKNYTLNFGEIDIIAETNTRIVFVEVKTRQESPMYRPALAVNYEKRKKIIRVASYYLKCNPTDKEIRFDIIEVFHKDKKITSINHIKNAFDRRGNYVRL